MDGPRDLHRGTVYWFTGLAGAGKSTLAKAFWERLRGMGADVILLDGDDLRKTIADDLGYSEADRRKSAMRNAKLCRLLAAQGYDVICATISMFKDCRAWLRDKAPAYREIYVRAPMEILRKRDKKGLYSSGDGRVAGVDFAVEEPEKPDVTIDNDGSRTPEEIVDEILPQVSGGAAA